MSKYILTNNAPSVNYTFQQVPSFLDMIKNLFKPQVKMIPAVVSATPSLEQYLNYSLQKGYLPEYQQDCSHDNVKDMGNGWKWCTDCGARWKE